MAKFKFAPWLWDWLFALRLLILAFTLRDQAIRVISARPMNEKEREFYASLRQE